MQRGRHSRDAVLHGESFRDVVVRTQSFLDALRSDSNKSTVCVVSHSANLWALKHLLDGANLSDLVDAPFAWQEGWEYRL